MHNLAWILADLIHVPPRFPLWRLTSYTSATTKPRSQPSHPSKTKSCPFNSTTNHSPANPVKLGSDNHQHILLCHYPHDVSLLHCCLPRVILPRALVATSESLPPTIIPSNSPLTISTLLTPILFTFFRYAPFVYDETVVDFVLEDIINRNI